jgi:hypothetical protein
VLDFWRVCIKSSSFEENLRIRLKNPSSDGKVPWREFFPMARKPANGTIRLCVANSGIRRLLIHTCVCQASELTRDRARECILRQLDAV